MRNFRIGLLTFSTVSVMGAGLLAQAQLVSLAIVLACIAMLLTNLAALMKE